MQLINKNEIKRKAIPANIKTTLETKFSGYKVEEAAILETASGSVYEFELEKGEEELEDRHPAVEEHNVYLHLPQCLFFVHAGQHHRHTADYHDQDPHQLGRARCVHGHRYTWGHFRVRCVAV